MRVAGKAVLWVGLVTIVLLAAMAMRLFRKENPESTDKPRTKPAARAEETDDANTPQISIRVVDPNGSPLGWAEVYQYYAVLEDQPAGEPYVCDSNGATSLTARRVFRYAHEGRSVLYAVYGDELGAFGDVNRSDIGSEKTIRLTPACHVYGAIQSDELTGLGQKVTWTNVYVYRGQERPLMYSSKTGQFSFLLPDGEYGLNAYGQRLYGKTQKIEVKGQRELKIDVNLPADRLAHLIGKEAPPLSQIKGWVNSWRGVKLSDLRGQVVLLDFWGTWCGPCVQAIPKLIDLHEKYSDRGLVIIAVHDDSHRSVRALKQKLGELSGKYWDGRRIPFAIALDGGGRCKVEGTYRTASGATTAAYGISAFPTMVLIDRQGRVVGDHYYPGYNDEVLERLLAEEPR